MGANLRSKGQGHWERKQKNTYLRQGNTSNQDQSGPLYRYYWIHFTSGNASFFCDIVCNYPGRPHVAAATWPCICLFNRISGAHHCECVLCSATCNQQFPQPCWLPHLDADNNYNAGAVSSISNSLVFKVKPTVQYISANHWAPSMDKEIKQCKCLLK